MSTKKADVKKTGKKVVNPEIQKTDTPQGRTRRIMAAINKFKAMTPAKLVAEAENVYGETLDVNKGKAWLVKKLSYLAQKQINGGETEAARQAEEDLNNPATIAALQAEKDDATKPAKKAKVVKAAKTEKAATVTKVPAKVKTGDTLANFIKALIADGTEREAAIGLIVKRLMQAKKYDTTEAATKRAKTEYSFELWMKGKREKEGKAAA